MLTPIVEPYTSSKTPFEIYQRIFRSSGVSFFLDSSRFRPPDQRYSYLGAGPFLELALEAGRLRVRGEERGLFPVQKFFSVLRNIFSKYRYSRKNKHPFFTGGAVGYFGYETASLFEKIRFRKKPGMPVPDLYLGFYREMIVYDHEKKRYALVAHQDLAGNRASGRRERIQKRLKRLQSYFEMEDREGGEGFRLEDFKPDISQTDFESMVRKTQEYIAAGDIYQANLSQRFSFQYRGSPLKIYEELRRINPSPFASFLKIRDLYIVSSSPERLIRKKGRLCETRPIAGTRPRRWEGKGPVAMAKDLLGNPKERAEHLMLVDLERNDLGRVCDYRSVRVREMMTTEKYSHVIHLVSKITGRLRKDRDVFDLLAAVFPGGTITGCPKIRCMEIIEELEKTRRQIYTGSIGCLDFKGDLDLNIVIRTLVLRKNRGYLQAGAGIVHDSEPAREYQETLHKGLALEQALIKACQRAKGLKVKE